MSRKRQGFQQGATKIVSILRTTSVLSSVALLLSLRPTEPLAQSKASAESPCFSIHVRLNGKPIDGPQIITLKTTQDESAVPLKQGCFIVPAVLLAEKTIGISFTIPGNKIDIPAIATGFFVGSWDVELEDKKFGNAVALPKHFRARQGCVIVFHTGDEPERGLSVMPCRSPLPIGTK